MLHPKTYLLENIDHLRENKIPIDYPVLTKPLLTSASRGIRKFENTETLLKYLLEQAGDDEYKALPILLQEYIPGSDINFNGFALNGRLCAWTVQEFIEIPRGKNKPLRWSQSVENDDILRAGTQII